MLVRAGFESDRIVLREMPCAECRLCERLFGREGVVDDRVRSGQRAVQAGDDICRIEFAKIRANLIARLVAADADDSLILQLRP